MEFWCALIGIVAFIALFPYIRCFFKRLTCMGKIKNVCKKKGYKIYATHSLWFLGSKHSNRCDLYIETENEVFAIKLFGILRRLTVLVFKENGEYFIRSFLAFIFHGASFNFPIDSKHKLLPTYDFRYKYKDEWKTKIPRRILLVNPTSMEFRRQLQHGTESIIGDGDIVNGMEIDPLPYLLGDLENAL